MIVHCGQHILTTTESQNTERAVSEPSSAFWHSKEEEQHILQRILSPLIHSKFSKTQDKMQFSNSESGGSSKQPSTSGQYCISDASLTPWWCQQPPPVPHMGSPVPRCWYLMKLFLQTSWMHRRGTCPVLKSSQVLVAPGLWHRVVRGARGASCRGRRQSWLMTFYMAVGAHLL